MNIELGKNINAREIETNFGTIIISGTTMLNRLSPHFAL